MCADVATIESLLRMFFRANGSMTEADMLNEHIDGLYGPRFWRFSRNRVDAEDLVHENLCSCYPHRSAGCEKKATSKSWMFSILRNIWFNQFASATCPPFRCRERISSRFCRNFVRPVRTIPIPWLTTSLDQDQVRQAISRLSVESREIILMREFEDLSYQEIAGILKCPIETVTSRLGRARSKLRALLSSTLAGGNSGEHS